MDDVVVKIEGLKKQYTLGTIGGTTLSRELQTWWAKKRGKEDPNSKIGSDQINMGEKFWALNGIDLEIRKGEAVGIIGHNGAGKSTLLKILSRVTAPTEGTVKMKGRISSMLEVGTGFHPELTGRENIYMNGAILGMSKKEIDAKLEEIIDFSECRQFIDTPVKRYSSGMYVKLAFAVAAHLDAEIMIMDEVLAVGDMKFQQKCLGRMGDAAENEGKTVLYVSHNMATIRKLCSRCIVLHKGELVYDGDVEKAISYYMKQEAIGNNIYYDLEKSFREKSEFGCDIRIKSLEFGEKEAAIFGQSESMQLFIELEARNTSNALYMYFQIYRDDNGDAVGGSTSEQFSVVQGNNKKKIVLSISNLAEGGYFFEIAILRFMPGGNHVTLDRAKQHIFFKVTQDNYMRTILWNRNIYGCNILPTARCLEEQ